MRRLWLFFVGLLHRRLLLAAAARPADVVIGPGYPVLVCANCGAEGSEADLVARRHPVPDRSKTEHGAPVACYFSVIDGGQALDYLRRWWILPRNRWFNVYLHRFGRSDDDRALHDHPWLFNVSVVLAGELDEHTVAAGGVGRVDALRAGSVRWRWGAAPHRLELRSVHAWTLFVTGPRLREWGFHCPRGWVRWQDFTDPTDAGRIGPGCGS